jgi:hypothetical protein
MDFWSASSTIALYVSTPAIEHEANSARRSKHGCRGQIKVESLFAAVERWKREERSCEAEMDAGAEVLLLPDDDADAEAEAEAEAEADAGTAGPNTGTMRLARLRERAVGWGRGKREPREAVEVENDEDEEEEEDDDDDDVTAGDRSGRDKGLKAAFPGLQLTATSDSCSRTFCPIFLEYAANCV